MHNKPIDLISTEADVTPFVLAAMKNTDNARLKEIVTALVKHLHAFIREARPTEEEFEYGLQILNSIGNASNDSHNEAVLYADILGISTLVDLINNNGMQGETMSALLGPFYRGQAPECDFGESIVRSETPGPALILKGRVMHANGDAIVGASLDVWQASPNGLYENQDAGQTDHNLRGKFTTDAEGRYEIHTVKPAGYPIPMDTPAGDLIRAQNRTPMRPAHVHFIVSAPECKTLITQIFSDTDEALVNDVVFGAKRQISGNLVQQGDGSFVCEYDFVLKPGIPTFPEPPIKGKVK